jgi:hypothetical protein
VATQAEKAQEAGTIWNIAVVNLPGLQSDVMTRGALNAMQVAVMWTGVVWWCAVLWCVRMVVCCGLLCAVLCLHTRV